MKKKRSQNLVNSDMNKSTDLRLELNECLNQLNIEQEKVVQLQLDLKKFNDVAYKAKKKVAQLELEVEKFNTSAYKAKKEVNRLNSLVKEQNIYISSIEEKLINIADDYNQLAFEHNTKVLNVEKHLVTLSYGIGQAFIKLKTLKGILYFIPNILNEYQQHKNRLKSSGKKPSMIRPISIEKLLTKRKNYVNLLMGIQSESVSPKITTTYLEQLSSSIPDSNGTSYYNRIPLNIAIVTDEFMFNYYNGAFKNLYYVNPDNYKFIFENNKIDAFLYVSCWSGMQNEDWRGIKYREKPMKAFHDILEICNKRGIKTIFQTIEDPSNYENFLHIAKKFDYIFTSAIEKIEDYQRDCQNSNVDYLEYGFNPVLNNPIGLYREVIDGVFFAGSYPQRYVDRCNDMHTMFSSIKQSSGTLIIADRNSNIADEKLRFPTEYKDNVIPAIQHKMLQKVHKLFRYNANFNSIKDSLTMCAMRVYELQAQGALLLSNYALSVSNKFPNIKMITMQEDLSSIFKGNKNINIEELLTRVNIIRDSMKDKSVFDQTTKMLNKCGFNVQINKPEILVIKLDDLATLPNQTYKNYSVISKEDVNKNNTSGYICCISSNNKYSPHYLEDLSNGFKYVDVDFITQSATINNKNEISGVVYDYINDDCIIDRSLIKASAFDISNLTVKSKNGFAVEPFGLDSTVIIQDKNNNPELSIIIPVYNNGIFLRDRCLSSLKRDSNFEKFQIILVDDGSNAETLAILDELEKQYQNITLYKYPYGGSGSASRARNKGIELARSNYITYLDPDNEISPSGYSTLLSMLKKQLSENVAADFITGYQNKITENNIIRNAYHTDKAFSYISDTKQFILNKNYPIISTQAFICKKSLILDNNIKFIEKAVGQDTLFGHEIMASSKGGLFSSLAYINYYAERKSSVTNVVDKNFFEKSLTLEMSQINKLKKLGLFEHYRENKFPIFYKDWYLVKLSQVSQPDKDICKKIVQEIFNLYQ